MKASFYNFMVRQDAYRRRGKEPIDTCLQAYEECVNQVVNRRLVMQQREIRSSKTYRIGKIILMPLRKIQAIFKHKS